MIGVGHGGEGETGTERARTPEDNQRATLGQKGGPAY